MADLLEILADEGTERAAGGNEPVLLDDPARAWLISAGRVDVFALSMEQGRPGERRHLFRAETGDLLFGMAGDDTVLLAAGTPATRVRRLARERIQALVGRAETSAAVVPRLERWVESLCAALQESDPPPHHVLAAPRDEPEVRPGDHVLAERGVLWAEQAAGTSRFLGWEAHALHPGAGFLPITSRTWIETVEAGRLRVHETAAWAREDPEWAGLDGLHAVAIARLGRAARVAELEARERFLQREGLNRASMGHALGQLAATFGPAEATPPEEEVDPLHLACSWVLQAMGVEAPPPRGTGPRDGDPLQAIARASRTRVRSVALRAGWWRADTAPMLAFRSADNHPMAVLSDGYGRPVLADPGTGARTPVTAQVAGTLSPFAHAFTPSLPARALKALDLLRLGAARCRRQDLLCVPLVGLGVGLLGLATPIITGVLFDRLLPSGARGPVFQAGAALLLMAGGAAMFNLARGFALFRVETATEVALQPAIWDRLLGLPIRFFRRYTAGDLAVRALGVDAIRQSLTGATLTSLLAGVFSIVNLGLLFHYDARLASVAAALVLVAAVATVLAGVVGLPYERTVQHLEGQLSGFVLQLVNGIAKLRVAAAEERAFARWARQFVEQRRVAFRARGVANRLATFEAAWPLLATAVVFAMAATATRSGQLSTGSFLAFNAAFGQFLAAWLEMGAVLISVMQVVPVYERARPIMEEVPEVDVGQSDPGELSGDIEFSHVSFRYEEGGPLVLDDVSLRIRPGEFVAIVGPSGAGKSTILRLLLGFETPESGSVYYDGKVLGGLDIRRVRRQIGVVLQNSRILPGTIFENIAGSAALTFADAEEAARMAGLDGDIAGMPMGMHTFLSEGGSTLSGGQRQRLLIARALVSRPRILLFDEATSALDNQTQAQVSRSLARLRCSRVVIAHRLSTIEGADRIYVVEGGRVSQCGTHAELIGQPGLFATLVRRQLA